MSLPLTARAFIALIVIAGAGALGYALDHGQGVHTTKLVVFLVVACLAARLKVKLPGLTGSMSVNLPFILVALVEMNMAEALIVACLSNLTQCLPRHKERFHAVQALFNFHAMALAAAATAWIYRCSHLAALSSPLRLMIAAAGFFLVNTTLVAVIMSLAEEKPIFRTCVEIFDLTLPYFVLSSAIAGVAIAGGAAWQATVVLLPVMFLVFGSYRRYFSSVPQAIANTFPESLSARVGGTVESHI